MDGEFTRIISLGEVRPPFSDEVIRLAETLIFLQTGRTVRVAEDGTVVAREVVNA